MLKVPFDRGYIYIFKGTKQSENCENTDQREQRMKKQVQTACRHVLQGVK